jgi:hypothetical protein
MLPHSLLVWSIVPRLTGTFAWSIAVAFLFDCRFIYLDFYQLAVSNTTEPIYAEPLRFGLLSHAAIQMTHNQHDAASNWTIYNAEECLRYSTNLAATKEFATAQVCAIVTVVLGGILSWMLWIMYCCRFVCLCIPSIMISLGFLLVLPVLQGISIFMLRTICTYRLDEPPLQDLLQQAPNFEYTQQLSTCGMSSLYGLYYPVSIAMWIITGLLFLGIRPRKDNDLNAVAMLP